MEIYNSLKCPVKMISKRAVQTTFKETATDTQNEQYGAPYYLIGVFDIHGEFINLQ